MGLTKGVVGEPGSFKVDTRGFPGDINITVEGNHPSLLIPSNVNISPVSLIQH